MEALQVFAAGDAAPDGAPPVGLPADLAALYGGPLTLGTGALCANFVQSLDGVVAIAGVRSPGGRIGLRSEADRFVMALLRAAADAVLVGGNTLREAPGHRWIPGDIFPPLAASFARMRQALGLPADPLLVVVTASGDLDPEHPALQAEARVVTTPAGAAVLGGRLPSACRLDVAAGERVDLAAVLAGLRADGFARVLSEAGPTVTHQLLAGGLLDELFVTVSPVLVGGDPSQVAGLAGREALAAWWEPGNLVSVRRSGSHLFLHYRRSGQPTP